MAVQQAFLGQARPFVELSLALWRPAHRLLEIPGTKCEDTILVQDTHNEVITNARDWPMLEVESDGVKYQRPDFLVK